MSIELDYLFAIDPAAAFSPSSKAPLQGLFTGYRTLPSVYRRQLLDGTAPDLRLSMAASARQLFLELEPKAAPAGYPGASYRDLDPFPFHRPLLAC